MKLLCNGVVLDLLRFLLLFQNMYKRKFNARSYFISWERLLYRNLSVLYHHHGLILWVPFNGLSTKVGRIPEKNQTTSNFVSLNMRGWLIVPFIYIRLIDIINNLCWFQNFSFKKNFKVLYHFHTNSISGTSSSVF